jgi:hypothetical protein
MSPTEPEPELPRPRRFIQLVHALPGRARFRLPWLHDQRWPEEVTRLADDLARMPGMKEVQIRAYTGSVLCLYDAQRLDDAAIQAELVRLTGVEITIGPGERPPVDDTLRRAGPGDVAQELARFFKNLDDEILTATRGKLDMGTLATFGFLGAGALNVAIGSKATAPPWFNLAWWGLRTFMLFEGDAVAEPGD